MIGAALEITETRCREAGVQIRLDQPAYPVIAMGGETRLGQVVANLIAKAVDAVAGRDDARLTVTLRSDPPRITVRDTGSGLANPAEIFDPVYTTKEVGAGLGLGLPIGYGILSGFGGPTGGATRGRARSSPWSCCPPRNGSRHDRCPAVEDELSVREALLQTLDLADLPLAQAGGFVAARPRLIRDLAGVVFSDIPVLFPHYLNLAGEHVDTPVPEVPSDMQARLMARDRPGNARGLMNRTMRFVMGLEDERGTPHAGLAARMRAVERSILIETLMRHGGQRSRSAARNVLRQARPTWPATGGLPAGLTCPDSRTGDGERPCKKPHSMWFSHDDQAVDD